MRLPDHQSRGGAACFPYRITVFRGHGTHSRCRFRCNNCISFRRCPCRFCSRRCRCSWNNACHLDRLCQIRHNANKHRCQSSCCMIHSPRPSIQSIRHHPSNGHNLPLPLSVLSCCYCRFSCSSYPFPQWLRWSLYWNSNWHIQSGPQLPVP